jgi:glutaredoxin
VRYEQDERWEIVQLTASGSEGNDECVQFDRDAGALCICTQCHTTENTCFTKPSECIPEMQYVICSKHSSKYNASLVYAHIIFGEGD